MGRGLVWSVIVTGLLWLQPRTIAAQTPGSVELGVLGVSDLSEPTEPAVGVTMLLNLSPRVAFNPTAFHVFRPDGPRWQIGGTFRYTPPVPVHPLAPYLGAGAAWTWTTLAGNGRSNVVWMGQVGLDLPARQLTPFVELQLLKYGTVRSQVAAGIRLALGDR
jgi:hypothetical protein